MPIIRPALQDIANYEASPAINQSSLKEIMSHGVQSFLYKREELQKANKYYEDQAHFLLGHATDAIICMEEGYFNSQYHVSKVERKPSDTMRTVMHMVLEGIQGDTINSIDCYLSEIHTAMNTVPTKDSKGNDQIGYYMKRAKANYAEDTRMMDLIGNAVCVAYWQDIINARGKEILSDSEYNTVMNIVNSWKTHMFTKDLFTDRPGRYIFYQIPLYFTILGVQCKALLDRLEIDIEQQVIIIGDFKTMSGTTLMFPKRKMRPLRYDFQAAYYTLAVKSSLDYLSSLVGYDITKFYIPSFKFIVESTTHVGMPLIFNVSAALEEQATEGSEYLYGYKEALEEYQYWADVDFNIEAAMSRTMGELWVDEKFNYVKP